MPDDRAPRFLIVRSLGKAFGAAPAIFKDVSFTIDRGEFICVIGHSGCGKTTILNILAGLDEATQGEVVMDGREVSGPSLDRGVVFQGHALMPWLDVRANIAFAVRSRWPDWTRAKVNAQVQKYIDLVRLTGQRGKETERALRRHEAARGNRTRLLDPAEDAAAR